MPTLYLTNLRTIPSFIHPSNTPCKLARRSRSTSLAPSPSAAIWELRRQLEKLSSNKSKEDLQVLPLPASIGATVQSGIVDTGKLVQGKKKHARTGAEGRKAGCVAPKHGFKPNQPAFVTVGPSILDSHVQLRGQVHCTGRFFVWRPGFPSSTRSQECFIFRPILRLSHHPIP